MSMVLSRVSGDIRTGRTRIASWYKRHSLTINLGALTTVFVVVAIWQWISVVIPAGYVGVRWYRFVGGTDTQTIYAEGSHFIWPWDRVTLYDTRLQQFSRDFDVLTRDGMMMTVNIACRFRLNEAMIGLLHKHVGAEYMDNLLVPVVGSFARIIFSQNSTDSVYTDRRIAVQDEIRHAVTAELDHDLGQPGRSKAPWLFLDDVLVRSMRFPPEVQSAVNRKMEQYQLREEYAYRLQREELESKRKEVEAQGIARFQSIVGAGISDTYLRWKGIDATLALAQSSNAKIVVIGTGKDGLPLILNGADAAPAASPPRDDGPGVTASAAPATPSANAAPAASPPTETAELPPALDEALETLRTLAKLGIPSATSVLTPSSESNNKRVPSSITSPGPNFVIPSN
jgi:regulator of protease activity HflC (stomatin/prohibitin superfamily)